MSQARSQAGTLQSISRVSRKEIKVRNDDEASSLFDDPAAKSIVSGL